MSLKTLNGDQAMAFGALSSGVKLVKSKYLTSRKKSKVR
jgi:hypothetical protein